jgi:phage repressor protein C with HTH and peptisase S24 domain
MITVWNLTILIGFPSVIHNQKLRATDHIIEVPNFREIIGSMGRGIVLRDQPGQITTMKVTAEWLQKNVPSNTGAQNLCVVTGFGDSMKGMFNSGDPLLVDTGIHDCTHDGVYFFRVGEEGFIKRLQRIPGEGIRVISENKQYETWTIKPDMDFQVFAKVLKVWESTDF